MPADANDPATLLAAIRTRATKARDAAPEAMRAALGEIADMASRAGTAADGDTPEPSDTPRTENQSL